MHTQLGMLGLKVGILDADIYGPSLPKLLAIKERPQTLGGTRLKPITRYGLTVMSIGSSCLTGPRLGSSGSWSRISSMDCSTVPPML